MARTTPEESKSRIPTARKAPSKGGKVTPIEYVRPIGETKSVYLFRQADRIFCCPADDELIPVIGIGDNADPNNLPPALESWLNEYSNEVGWWQRVGHTLDVDEGAASGVARESITPLVPTKWAQGNPYNTNLTFDGKTSLVGCAAVAIGQIIYYWGTRGYHRGCTKTKAYKTKTNLYDVAALPPLTVFDYVHLVAKKPSTKTNIEAVASLLERVGKALQSDYAVGGTSVSTDKLVPVLRDYLRMGKGVKEVYSAYTSVANFESTIYKEINAHRPVILFGTGERGGHFFVCDGYDAKQGLYHMNWGWGGSCDGYYALSALNPSNKAYNTRRRAYVGINPDYKLGDVNGDGDINVADVMQVANNVTSGKYDEKSDVNSDGKVTVTDVTAVVDHVLGKQKL